MARILTDGSRLGIDGDGSIKDLEAFAERIGLKAKWLDDLGDGRPGFRLATALVARRAVEAGAVEVAPSAFDRATHRRAAAAVEGADALPAPLAVGDRGDDDGGDDGGGAVASAGGLPDGCPIAPLGWDMADGVLYVLGRGGVVRAVRAKDLSAPVIEDLFGGHLSWLYRAFPKLDGDGVPVGVLWAKARTWIIRACHDGGYFDPEKHVRGPGAWRGADRELLVHVGDKVLTPAGWIPAGCSLGGIIYTTAPPEQRPADVAAPAKVGLEILGFLEAWRWMSPPLATDDPRRLSAKLWLGWVACAYVCGALRWRPHILITGARGTGKSELATLADALLGEKTILKAAEPSAAGVRQALRSAARPVMLDEVEHDADNNRAKRLVELARLASTDSQGAVLRGSVGGRHQQWLIRAVFYFSAILYPRMPPQDASRITVLALAPLGDDATPADRVRDAIAEFGRHGPALRTRMIEGLGRFERNLRVYSAAFAQAGGDSRQCDQFGTLLAAADVLISDDDTRPETADAVAAGLMASDFADAEGDSDHDQCLQHLLSTAVEVPGETGGRRRITLGQLAAVALEHATAKRRGVLGTFGLTVRDEGKARYLAVAHQHRGLDDVFRGSRWQDGVWSQALARLPGARKCKAPLRFAGSQSRVTLVPRDLVPPVEKYDDDPSNQDARVKPGQDPAGLDDTDPDRDPDPGLDPD